MEGFANEVSYFKKYKIYKNQTLQRLSSERAKLFHLATAKTAQSMQTELEPEKT